MKIARFLKNHRLFNRTLLFRQQFSRSPEQKQTINHINQINIFCGNYSNLNESHYTFRQENLTRSAYK